MACARIAGAHKLYYAPFGDTTVTALGATGDEGIRVTGDEAVLDITSDELGPSTVVDGVYQGKNLELEFVVQELNSLTAQMFLNPWQQTYASAVATGVSTENLGVPGRLVCAVWGTLEAIPVDFTSAADFRLGGALGAGTAVYPGTANTAVAGRRYRGLVIGAKTENMDNNPRFVPIRFKAYPFQITSGGVWKMWQWITAVDTPSQSYQ